MSWICGKSPQSIDAGGLALGEWAGTRAPGVRNSVASIRGRQMENFGSGLIGMVGFGTSPSPGDQPLFEELAMPLFASLYNFARWLVQNSDDAEDLVQETYLKALRGFASFQPGTNFRAWLFQILKNTFLTSCSKAKRVATVALESEEDLPPLPMKSDNAESMLV